MSRFWVLIIFLAAAVSATAQVKGKPPVIIIPGVTGSELVNRTTQKKVWFGVKRDKLDDLRLPTSSPNLRANRDTLVAGDIIRAVELPILPDVEVYQTLLDALMKRGYTEATWDKPAAADAFYVFPYDWRRDNVENAQILVERMESAKRKLGKPDLKFDIIAHSMGGLLARYAAMYGRADLPARGTPRPTWAGAAHINKLLMFGTPNEGAMASFDAFINGYPIILDRKLPLIDDFRSEDVASNPSAFQLLPHQDSARFLDENLKPLRVDLYSLGTWLKYGWGPLADPKFLAKLKDAPQLARRNPEIKPEKLGKDAATDDILLSKTTYAQYRSYFVSALNRARMFHAALDTASTNTPVQIYAYGGNCADTLDAAVLVRDPKKDRWQTIVDAKDFKRENGTEVKKNEVKAAIYAIGDSRVTQRSLLGETSKNGGPEITNINFASSFFACGLHTKLFLEQPIQESFLSALVVEKAIQP
jgi:pimeloyl-ACP methyl ester carboxylesterase